LARSGNLIASACRVGYHRPTTEEGRLMLIELNDFQTDLRDMARQIAEEKMKPVRAHYDETEEFPWPIVKVFAEADLYRVYVPEAYEGLGGGVFEMALVTEELSRVCGGIALAFAASALGAYPLILFGSEEQKQKYLPDLAAGRKLAAFALTEAGAGSDAAGLATTAVRKGDAYVLNGTKQWITNGGEAETYTVIARTDKSKGPRGFSAFIVEKGTPGFSFGKKEQKMGIRGSTTRELVFADCAVPAANLIGREGIGFKIAMETLDRTRPGVAAQAVGIAEGALEAAVQYARERRQFNGPIANLQAIQQMLAEMATQVEAARSLIYLTARRIDSGAGEIAKFSAMSKAFASDVAMKVTTDAVQIFGGYGYMKDYPVEKMMRDAKITQIYEGTNQIQRGVIARQLVKEMAAAH
jgi:alkylation response protein AidB-like acyl-CoA dehydrogenase